MEVEGHCSRCHVYFDAHWNVMDVVKCPSCGSKEGSVVHIHTDEDADYDY